MEELYEDLSATILLENCQRRLTSNVNESLHSKSWSKAGKHKYHGEPRLRFCVQATTLDHNCGFEAASLLHKLGVGRTPECLQVLRLQDHESALVASRRSKRRRRQDVPADAGPDYAAGEH